MAYRGNICVELFHVMNVGVGSQHKGSHQDKQKKDLSCLQVVMMIMMVMIIIMMGGSDDDFDGSNDGEDDCNDGGSGYDGVCDSNG